MELAYWHWLLLGFGMVIAELALPGTFFLWVGIAAFGLSGLVLGIPELSVTVQLVTFGIFAPLVMIAGRKVFRVFASQKLPSLLNRRAQQHIGQVIVLDVPIVHGQAHVTIGDSKWRIHGPDLPAGTGVKITAVEGNMFVVIPDNGKLPI